jgi:hypothetical protein
MIPGGPGPLVNHPVVVGLDAEESQFLVGRLVKRLPAEPGERREAQGGEDAVAVHVLQSGERVITSRAHVLVTHRGRGELLLLPAGGGREADSGETPPLVDPGFPLIVRDDVGGGLLEALGDAVLPDARWLDHVVVNGNQPVQAVVHASTFFTFS